MITVVIKSAEMARAEAEPNEVKRKIEELEEKQKWQAEEEKRIAQAVEIIKTKIQNRVNKGYCSIYETIYQNERLYTTLTEWGHFHFDHKIEEVLKVFQEAGYRARFEFYSDSWRSRSGKVGHLIINW